MKLILQEQESQALDDYLERWPDRTSSALLQVEALRAARPHGSDSVEAAVQRLEHVALITIDSAILQEAASIGPQGLRSLDAIHLATARQLGGDLDVLITYDQRLARAAADLGMRVASPS